MLLYSSKNSVSATRPSMSTVSIASEETAMARDQDTTRPAANDIQQFKSMEGRYLHRKRPRHTKAISLFREEVTIWHP